MTATPFHAKHGLTVFGDLVAVGVNGWVYSNPTKNGDVNSGFFLDGTNNVLRAYTNKLERMRIDASGRMGIGISPSDQLHVLGMIRQQNVTDGNDGINFRNASGASLGIIYGFGTSYFRMQGSTDIPLSLMAMGTAPIAFGNSGNELARLSAAGLFGLNTSTPSYLFDAVGSDTTVYASSSTSAIIPGASGKSGALMVRNSSNADGTGSFLYFASNNTAGSTNLSYLGSVSTSGTTSPSIVFGQRTGASAFNERMRIDPSGNVGIGNSAPGSKLDVTGLARAAGFGMNATGGSVSTGMAAPAADTLALYTNTVERLRIDSAGYVSIGTAGNNPNNRYLFVRSGIGLSFNGTTEAGKWYHDGTLGYLDAGAGGQVIYAGNVERVRIEAGGNVGFGTTAPTFGASYAGIHVHNSTAAQGAQLHLTNAAVGATNSDGASITVDAAGRMGVWNHESSSIMFATNNLERMQLDANGNLSLGFNSGAVGKFAISPGQNGINGTGGDAKLIVDTLLGVTNDAAAAYVLISPKYVSGTVAASGFDGVISAFRGNATTNHRTQKVEVTYRVAYNTTVVGKLDGDFRLVELTYNSNPWIAVELPADSSRDVYIQGRFWGATPALVQAANVSGVASFLERSAFVAAGASASIVTAGTEKVRVDATGNVGIGTTTPGVRLDIQGTGGVEARILSSGTVARLRLLDTAGNASISTASGALILESGSAERVRIDSAGRVGIGINNPTYDLHLNKSSGATVAGISNAATTSGNFSQLAVSTGTAAWSVGTEAGGTGRFFVYNNAASLDQLVFSGGTTSSVSIVALGAAPITLTSNSTERARIDVNGNFGVGTAGPTNYTGYKSIALNGTDGGIVEFMSAGAQSARLTGWANTFAIHTANVERLRIDSAGSILSTGGGPLGYGGGSGGTVTQATSRTTGVTINKPAGAITLFTAAGATAWTSFTVTNSTVQVNDTIRVCQRSGANKYQIHVTAVGNGSFEITFNTTGGTTSEAPVFNFNVMRGSVL